MLAAIINRKLKRINQFPEDGFVIIGVNFYFLVGKQFKGSVKTESMVQMVVGQENFNFFFAFFLVKTYHLTCGPQKTKQTAPVIMDSEQILKSKDTTGRRPVMSFRWR